ncbi:hypothetical protein ACP26L_19125 [Paenibacillus sp. S-38]|uniref:hypothetical protein n=1 Tax=Paenibacillus sp. S-38 TaxID=3416710 RepID=UPI003CF966D4
MPKRSVTGAEPHACRLELQVADQLRLQRLQLRPSVRQAYSPNLCPPNGLR